MKNINNAEIKTYSKAELRLLYNISEDTLRRWLNKVQDKLPYYNPKCKILSPLQVKVFFEYFGKPFNLN